MAELIAVGDALSSGLRLGRCSSGRLCSGADRLRCMARLLGVTVRTVSPMRRYTAVAIDTAGVRTLSLSRSLRGSRLWTPWVAHGLGHFANGDRGYRLCEGAPWIPHETRAWVAGMGIILPTWITRAVADGSADLFAVAARRDVPPELVRVRVCLAARAGEIADPPDGMRTPRDMLSAIFAWQAWYKAQARMLAER